MNSLWIDKMGNIEKCTDTNLRSSYCPSFKCRKEVYVDKHANGLKNGSSWEDAYNDLQTAINKHPYNTIKIKGYGRADSYTGGLKTKGCTHLVGTEDTWISGAGYNKTTHGFYYDVSTHYPTVYSKFENISIRDCCVGFRNYWQTQFINCKVEYCYSGWDYLRRVDIENCSALNCIYGVQYCYQSKILNFQVVHTDNTVVYSAYSGFHACNTSTFTNCYVKKFSRGFDNDTYDNIYTNCEADSCYNYGFMSNNSQIIECRAHHCGVGFAGHTGDTFTRCNAYSNKGCGFMNYYGNNATYVDCTQSGNCTDQYNNCTPSHPDYLCVSI